MLFSVIVPVYNVEKYLSVCLDSLISEKTGSKCEIILCDDGSTDLSGRICDEYAEKYDFIRVIHQKNGGLSNARNSAMKTARGDFLVFIDSDDFVETNVFADFLGYIERHADTDIFITDFMLCDANGGNEKPYIQVGKSSDAAEYLSQKGYCFFVWRMAFSRRLIEQNGIEFPDGELYEDIFFTPLAMINAKKIQLCTQNYYCYRYNRPDSITTSVGAERELSSVHNVAHAAAKMLLEHKNASLFNPLMNKIARETACRSAGIYDLEKDKRNEYADKLSALTELFKTDAKVTCAEFIPFRLLPFNAAAKLLHAVRKAKRRLRH